MSIPMIDPVRENGPDDAIEAAPEIEPESLLEPRDGLPRLLTRPSEVAELAERLAGGSGPVAIDAERASGYRYGQRAYLVQLRRAGVGTALIDTAAVRDLSAINESLADAEWVLHAASQDLTCLGEVGLRPRLLFDTELGARLAGLPRVGLGALVEELMGLRLEKGHSASDWSTRPLPREWLVYAALDVEVLVELRDEIAQLLQTSGKLAWAEEEFAALLATPPAGPRVDPWRRTSGLRALHAPRQLAALRSLWYVREGVAMERDIAPSRILQDKSMVAAVLADPGSPEAMLTLPVFKGRANRRLIRTWYGALDEGRALPEDQWPTLNAPVDGPPPANRWADRAPEAALRLAAVRGVIADLVVTHSIPAENLLTPDLLRRVTWDPPTPVTEETIAERLRIGGARPWQIALTTPPLAVALADGNVVSGE